MSHLLREDMGNDLRVIQLMPTITYGDAVSNDALAIDKALKNSGFDTIIYAENIGNRIPKAVAGRIEPDRVRASLTDRDIIIYHGSTGTDLNKTISALPGKKVLRYHNITPSHFFRKYSPEAELRADSGLNQFMVLKDEFRKVIADSTFNRDNLREMGYSCNMEVCPVLIPFEDYKQKPDEEIEKKYRDGITNILFVGRVAPNKKHEDLIASFYAYQKLYDPDSRLILAGSWEGMELYYQRLVEYVKELGLEQKVVFTGHIPFHQILAFYRIADVFLCLSEHEGFCVPLIEAMCFNVPIAAYDCCAISETLGEGGILLSDKKPQEVAAVLDYLLQNDEVLSCIKRKQKERLKGLTPEIVSEKILGSIRKLTEEL